jgi:hypothetical protein
VSEPKLLKAELVVSYPRAVDFKQRYPLIVDLKYDPNNWMYEQAQFSLTCITASHHLAIQSEDSRLFISRTGETKPARFILWARKPGSTLILLTILSEGGVPILCQDLTGIQVEDV